MPIQSYKRPDGTTVLWNTDEAASQPMELPAVAPQALGGSTAGAFAGGEEGGGEQGLSEYGFKLKPTGDDKSFVRDALKKLKAGDLTDTEKDKLAMSMLEQHLFSIQDDGGVYGAFKHLPGGKDSKSAIVDLFDQFHDRASDAVKPLGVDTDNLTPKEIFNLYKSRDDLAPPAEDQPTQTTGQWKGNVEGQIAQAKGMTGQFQLGAWHDMGGEGEE